MRFSTRLIAVIFAFAVVSPVCGQMPFKRGDANGDRCVDLDDVGFMEAALLGTGPQPDCLAAADANDDGAFDFVDQAYLLNWLVVPSFPAPPDPGPEICGPDPNPETLGCEFYDGCAPCVPGSVSLWVENTVAAPAQQGASLYVRGTFDVEVLGYSISVTYDPTAVEVTGLDLVGTAAEVADFFAYSSGEGWATAAVVMDIEDPIDQQLSPSTDVALVHCLFDVAPSVVVGDTTTVDIAHMLTGDSAFPVETLVVVPPGHTIRPDRAPGTIEFITPATLVAGDASGVIGQSGIPHFIQATYVSSLLAYSIAMTFDETVLGVDSLSLTGTVAETADFFAPQFGPGWAAVGVVMDTSDPIDTQLFPAADVSLLQTAFSVLPTAVAGTITPIEIVPEVPGDTPFPVQTLVVVPPGYSVAPNRVPGSFEVIPGSPFRRGWCSPDLLFDVADPIFLLSYLHIDGEAPTCMDACDSNDDGAVDIADPVHMLSYLFVVGSPAPPAPFDACGVDTTLDDMIDCTQPICPE